MITRHGALLIRPWLGNLRGSNVWLLVAAVLLSLLAAEVALQVHYRLTRSSWLRDETRGFRVGYTSPVDDRRQFSLRSGYSNEALGLEIDARGFRRTGLEQLAAATSSIVVALGDSVPFGAEVRDRETYPAMLAALSAEFGIDVVNAGVPSYNLRQSFDRLRMDVLRYYDWSQIAVVTLQAANDISLLTQYREDWTPDVTWADVRWNRSWDRPDNVAILHYSRLVFRRLFNWTLGTEEHAVFDPARMIVSARDTLRELAILLDTNEVPLVLLPVDPFYYQTANRSRNATLEGWDRYGWYVELWDDAIMQFNDELKAAAVQHENVLFFDTRPMFDVMDRDALYSDFIHYTPLGNQMIAESLMAFLENHSIIVPPERARTR